MDRKKNPRSGLYTGTITLVNSEWYRHLPAKMRRELLRLIGETADDMQSVTWVMRVASERRWHRNVS
jgi:hypothetical protein